MFSLLIYSVPHRKNLKSISVIPICFPFPDLPVNFRFDQYVLHIRAVFGAVCFSEFYYVNHFDFEFIFDEPTCDSLLLSAFEITAAMLIKIV